MTDSDHPNALRAIRLGIDTHRQPVIYMPASCPVCRSEGFRARSRVLVAAGGHSVEAVLHMVEERLVPPDAAGLSETAWEHLQVHEGDHVVVHQARPLRSMANVRRKLEGGRLGAHAMNGIIQDIAAGRYADEHLAAFVAACASDMDLDEVIHLTNAMVEVGQTLHWPHSPVVDKHCVGGLAGNRTTPIVVAIGVAAGLCMPKTSSRAITSPAGTADTMATLTRVDLGYDEMQEVVEQVGGCLAWGGSVDLSPTDDMMIRIERSLELDSPGQMVASILSKKKAAGSTHCLIDIPVGKAAKVRSEAAADRLGDLLRGVGQRIGLQLDILQTDGSKPIGRGIGPCLEARDVLAVLQGLDHTPVDLRARGLLVASRTLELGGAAEAGDGMAKATRLLDSGEAWTTFKAICNAQGGLWTPDAARHKEEVAIDHGGTVTAIDNQGVARMAKLAGAPDDPTAGLYMDVNVGDQVRTGDTVFTIHCDFPGSLRYALEYLEEHGNPIHVA